MRTAAAASPGVGAAAADGAAGGAMPRDTTCRCAPSVLASTCAATRRHRQDRCTGRQAGRFINTGSHLLVGAARSVHTGHPETASASDQRRRCCCETHTCVASTALTTHLQLLLQRRGAQHGVNTCLSALQLLVRRASPDECVCSCMSADAPSALCCCLVPGRDRLLAVHARAFVM